MAGSTFSIRKAISFGWTTTLEHIWLFIKVAFTFIGVELVLFLGYIPIFLGLYLTEGSKLAVVPIGLSIAYTLALFLCIISMGYLGLPRILLDLYEHKTSNVSRMLSAFRLIFPYIGASIIFAIIILIPTILASGLFMLVAHYHFQPGEAGAPGIAISLAIIVFIASILVSIYLGIRFVYFSFALVDKNLGVISCLRYSWNITRGSVLKLILFSFALALMLWGIFVLVGLNTFGLINALNSGWYSLAFISGLLLVISILLVILAIPMVMLSYTYVYKKLSERADKGYKAPTEK